MMTAAMLAATLYIVRRVPNIYESQALIVVTADTKDERLVQAVPFNLLTQSLKSRANLSLLLSRYNLYPEIKDHDNAVGKLHKAIRVETRMRGFPETPDLITITYRHSDPVRAQRVVADLTKPFEEANLRSNELASEEEISLETKIKEVEERLGLMGSQRDFSSIRDRIAREKDEAQSVKSNRLALQATIETLTERQYALERQISDVQKQVADQERTVRTSAATTSLTTNPAYGALLVKKVELETQIKEYSPQYTEKHPKMASLRAQLTDINRQIERLESPTGSNRTSLTSLSSPEFHELRSLQRELSKLNVDLEIVRYELSRKTKTLQALPHTDPYSISESDYGLAPGVETEFARLTNLKNWLLDKKDTLLKQVSGRRPESPMFRLVNTPNIPEVPVAPNRNLLKLIALVLSVCFGLFVVFSVQLPKLFLINDDRDIQYYLGTPILALIPETTTPIERARQRKLRLTRGLVIVLVAAALVPTMILLLTRLQIFQILGAR